MTIASGVLRDWSHGSFTPAVCFLSGSGRLPGSANTSTITAINTADTRWRNKLLPRTRWNAASRNGHATAPALQEKFRRLRAEERFSGLAWATIKFVDGIVSQIPIP